MINNNIIEVEVPLDDNSPVSIEVVDNVRGERGYSAYEVWLLEGNEGSVQDYLAYTKGERGEPFRYSDFTGEQLELLKVKGDTGSSAYQIAQKNGFTGTEDEWLQSLIGPVGKSAGIAHPTVKVTTLSPDMPAEVKITASGEDTAKVFDFDIKIPKGGIGGTGETGATGKSAYQIAVDNGYIGTEQQFGNEQAVIAGNSARLSNLEGKQLETLIVTVSGSTIPSFSFSKVNFDAVVNAISKSAAIKINITDSRVKGNRKPIDYSGLYNTTWNHQLQQLECVELAVGFYLKDGNPTIRVAKSYMTANYSNFGISFNQDMGTYSYNKIDGISEYEASIIYDTRHRLNNCIDYRFAFSTLQVPTVNFRNQSSYALSATSAYGMFANCDKLKHILLPTFRCTDIGYFARRCSSLEIVELNCEYITNSNTIGTFYDCFMLHTVNLNGLNCSVSFFESMNLTKESMQFIINNRRGINQFTLTLHATAKARLTDEDIALAVSKNITIA